MEKEKEREYIHIRGSGKFGHELGPVKKGQEKKERDEQGVKRNVYEEENSCGKQSSFDNV